MSGRKRGQLATTSNTPPLSSHMIYKVGINGVTLVPKPVSDKDHPTLTLSSTRRSLYKSNSPGGGILHNQKDGSAGEGERKHGSDLDDAFGMNHGVITSDEFSDINSSNRVVTQSRLARVSEADMYGKISVGTLMRFIEETGTIVGTRYCNYAGADISIKTGNVFEQVHCGMVYLDYMELVVPAFVGELLSCVAEVVFTSSHHLELRSAVWAEDLAQSGKRLICKSQSWYSAFDIKNNWRLTRVPKLILETRMEKEGMARYEQYKFDRRQFNDSKITYSKPGLPDMDDKTQPSGSKILQSSRRFSESVLTHIADIHDCGTHTYMHCGAVISMMEECAYLVASKHSRGNEVQTSSGYHFNFLELVPRGSLMIFYARLSFTSKRVVEVEVLADIELLLDQQLETKRVAAGYFCFLSLNNEHRIVPVVQIKPQNQEEEAKFLEGMKRFESMRKHLKVTEKRVTASEVFDTKNRKGTLYGWKRNKPQGNQDQ